MSGPFVYVEVDSTSAKQAVDVVARVRERLIDELDARQRELGAPTATYVVLMDIVPPTPPEAGYTSKIMGAAMALVLTLFLALSIAYGLRKRRRNKAARAAAEAAAEPPAVPERKPEPVVNGAKPIARNGSGEEDDMPTDSFPAVVLEEGANGESATRERTG